MSISKQKRTYQTILFDLDGTLITTQALIVACFEFSLATLGLKVPKEELVAHIGLPLKEQFKRFFALNAQKGANTVRTVPSPLVGATTNMRFFVQRFLAMLRLSKQQKKTFPTFPLVVTPQDLDTLAERHMAYQQLIWQRYVHPFPTVHAALATLQQKGKTMAIVTSRYKKTALPYLKATKLLDFFPLVITPEATPRAKPYPDPIFYALHQLAQLTAAADAEKEISQNSAHPTQDCLADTLYVGDTLFDSQAAAAAGVDFYQIDWEPALATPLSSQPTASAVHSSTLANHPPPTSTTIPPPMTPATTIPRFPTSTYYESNFAKLLTL